MSRPSRRIAGWVALAVAGLALAIGVAYVATELVTQHIALSGPAGSNDPQLVAPTQTEQDRSDDGAPRPADDGEHDDVDDD